MNLVKRTTPLAQPLPDAVQGAAWLLIVVLLVASGWLVAKERRPLQETESLRHAAFVSSTAAIQHRITLLRQLEKQIAASEAAPERARYYRQRREETRRRIDELGRSAASVAETVEERTRLEHLAALTRIADARYEQVLASSRKRQLIVQSEGGPIQ